MWGAFLGSLFGSLGSGIYSAYQARKTQQKQIQWERERATHAHQWEVQDLINAGLNPVLSAGGSGATTGGISAPMGDTSGLNSIGDNIFNAINTAITANRAKSEIMLQAEQASNIAADTQNKQEQTAVIKGEAILKQLQAGLIDKQTAQTELENQLKTKQISWYEKQQWAELIDRYASVLQKAVTSGAALYGVGKIKNIGQAIKGYSQADAAQLIPKLKEGQQIIRLAGAQPISGDITNATMATRAYDLDREKYGTTPQLLALKKQYPQNYNKYNIYH